VNPSKLTILAADTDAACDPETGACAVPQTSILTPDATPATSTTPDTEETPDA
jgi:hypothetical protein